MKYGNNVTSDYTFNANTLRLSNILTKKPDGTTKLQDLSYSFDNNGNVSGITDAVNSMSQTFTYDDLNRLTQAVGSAYGTQSFAYDSIGNMTSKAGRTMTYGVAGSKPHAVTNVSWTGSNYPTFCRDYASGACGMGYDANGNMTVRGQDTLSYDSENRLVSMTVREGASGTTNYTLKAGWNVISFTHLPNDKSVSNVMSGLTFGTDYNQVSTWDSASGTWKHWLNDSQFNDFTEFQYGKTYEIYNNSGSDKFLSVTGITNGADLTHNIISGDNFISPAVKTATNVTTVLAGLTQGTHYSDVKRFNATSQTWESFAGSAFTQFEPGKGYNIIGLTSASFSYGKTETTTTFVYDSEGQRIKKTVGGTTTIYLGNDYDITGSTSTKYIYLGDRRLSTKDSTGVLQFIHDDHISSSNIITDASGNQAGLFEYDPYGVTVTHTGSADPKHKFTGQEEDSSTKLYNYGARYYDPQLGRFITADWFVPSFSNPQDLNRYAYARNNPINYTDPTGNFPAWLGWLLAGLIIAKGIADGQASEKAGGNFWGGFGKSVGVSLLALGAAVTAGALVSAILPAGSTTAGLLQGTLKLINWAGEGAAAGLAGNTVVNAAYGRPLGENAKAAAGWGAALNVGLKGINEVIKGFKNSAGANARKSLDEAGLGKNSNTRAEIKIGEQLPDKINPTGAVAGTGAPKGVTVIGHWEDVRPFLNKSGFNVLNLPSNEYSWAKNIQWMDDAIARGDNIYTATDVSKVGAGRTFARELNYLRGKGFKPKDSFMVRE